MGYKTRVFGDFLVIPLLCSIYFKITLIFMYVSSARSSSQLESLPFQVDDNVLAPSQVVRNLGVSIDSALSMTLQVKDVYRKAIYQLRLIG
jgi:hypothetical protein